MAAEVTIRGEGVREVMVGSVAWREEGFRTGTMVISKSSSAAAIGDVTDR